MVKEVMTGAFTHSPQNQCKIKAGQQRRRKRTRGPSLAVPLLKECVHLLKDAMVSLVLVLTYLCPFFLLTLYYDLILQIREWKTDKLNSLLPNKIY
jgi:hypothetical protein